MSLTLDPDDIPAILSVNFGDGAIQITYIEPREMNDAAALQRTLSMDVDHVKEEVKEVMESLLLLLDAGAVLIRNPPEKISGRKALLDLGDD